LTHTVDAVYIAHVAYCSACLTVLRSLVVALSLTVHQILLGGGSTMRSLAALFPRRVF